MARKDLTPNPDFSKIVKINYRPFDTRYTYYTGHSKGFHCMPRGKVMRHFIKGENVGLVFRRQQLDVRQTYYFITNNMIADGLIRSDNKGSESVASLYLYPDSDELDHATKRQPNLNMEIVAGITEQTGLRFTAEKEETENTLAPVDILDYIYAVLHSPAYREKYREFLKIDFPRVPYPKNAEQFTALVALGATLRGIHLLETVDYSGQLAGYPIEGNNTVDKPEYRDAKIWINKQQYFDEVPHAVWDFYIGGYQPAQKWLKDRKGRSLNYDEIEHYQKILIALHLTIEIQAQIDEVKGV